MKKLDRPHYPIWPTDISFTIFHNFPPSSGFLEEKIFIVWANKLEEGDKN